MATPKGPQVVKEKVSQSISSCKDVKMCVVCSLNFGEFSCTQCYSRNYCSKQCQKKDWKRHQVLCEQIAKVESEKKQRKFEAIQFSGNSNLTPKQKLKLVKLVCPKCTVDCTLDGVETISLWDTGAEVTAVGAKWMKENFPEKEIKDVSELLGEELFLKVANNSTMDYTGYTEMVFMMSDSAEPLLVPFLVVPEVTMPIIGNNVIEEVIKSESSKGNYEVTQVLSKALKNIGRKQIEGLVNLIQEKFSGPVDEEVGIAKTGCKKVIIPKGSNVKITCISHCGTIVEDTPVIFQPDLALDLQNELVVGEGIIELKRGKTCRFVIPVSNPGMEDVVLSPRTPVGKLVCVVHYTSTSC